MGDPTLPALRFSTAGVAPAHQFEAYAEAAGTVFAVDRTPGPPRLAFRGELAAWRFGDLVLRRTSSDGVLRSTRTARAIARDQMDHWAITAWRGGTNRGEMGEHPFDMRPGHIYLYGLHVPGRWERSAAAWNMLLIPRDALPDIAHAFDTEIGRSAPLPLAPLVWSHIDALDRALELSTPAQGAALAEATLALLRALLGGRDQREAARPVLQETQRRRVLGLIRGNLASARLTPGRLAALAGMSRTRLYALFEAEGGVARAVQRERLSAIAAALADARERRSIAAVAEAYGMPDPSVFSRAFRRHQGMTAGEFREAARLGHVRVPAAATQDLLGSVLRVPAMPLPRAA